MGLSALASRCLQLLEPPFDPARRFDTAADLALESTWPSIPQSIRQSTAFLHSRFSSSLLSPPSPPPLATLFILIMLYVAVQRISHEVLATAPRTSTIWFYF